MEIRSRLSKLRARKEFFNNNNNNTNAGNNFLLPPPSPPPAFMEYENNKYFLPPPPLPPPLPPIQHFFQPPPVQPPKLQQAQFFRPPPLQRAKNTNTAATNTTQKFSGDRLIGELERVIEKEKPRENIVPEDDIIFHLPKIPTILDNEDFEEKPEIKKITR